MDRTIILPRRFCGPPDSANGGFAAGSLAQYLEGPVEVTLRRPPPLERPLAVVEEVGRVLLCDGNDLVAEACPTMLELDLVRPVTIDVALGASRHSPFLDSATHPFPTCFTCGPLRADGDGLRVFAGRVRTSTQFAATWVPGDEVDIPIVWAALDCPSAAPMYLDDDRPAPHVLGRIAARVERLPEIGHTHVIMSWLLAREGRKFLSASAIYDSHGECCAFARATWIRLQV